MRIEKPLEIKELEKDDDKIRKSRKTVCRRGLNGQLVA